MRISTSMIFDAGVAAMGQQQEAMLHTQQQIASGKRMLTAADDPVAAALALNVTESDNINTQYSSNRDTAKNLLGLSENALQSVTNLLQSVRTTAVNAGDPTLTDSDRASLAQALVSAKQQLLGLANTTDGAGNYLFAGYKTSSVPFAQGASGVQYLGDQGQNLVQVSASRQLPSSESGYQVFQNVMAGNGTFVSGAASTNAGTGTISPGSVANPAAITGDSYQINFAVSSANVTTYDIVDTTTLTTLSSNNAYTPGAAIVLGGKQVLISGAPANGDRFTVVPSTNQSMFDTLDHLISALQSPSTGSVANARLANNIGSALTNIDQDLNHVLDVRAGIGARINEVDALSSFGDTLGVQYKQELSRLQDVDIAGAISTLSQQQLALQAAQKSFVQTSGLSLFQYL